MAEVLLFHHALGLTEGVRSFADELRRGGHTVHVPDLYEGRTFTDLEAGLGHARETGFDTLLARGERAAEGLPEALVLAGLSLGALPAQKLAQTRSGSLGAVLISACVPVDEFGPAWPAGVPVQVHAMDADPFFVDDGDLAAARALVADAPDRKLFLYPGSRHLFTEAGTPSHAPEATALCVERVLCFLDGVRG
ncbi:MULTISPECIES: dienelactone hydrolase family protein [unclassified Streptomyces]|uniref:dienelactone hydrolase family protein n=1 Tax=unclassified Streptomyces TaxID=2593676 RepID=UPI0006FE728F|nr:MULTISPECIES: dienelactone hydrolase family protein [unclassified Streptomyces]KQX50012.1 dienelactone hydrolase [Streptomyces sp. Root1304]KRA79945.1 dienelactone hydrolase [Streptomyces sp. Root66D1]